MFNFCFRVYYNNNFKEIMVRKIKLILYKNNTIYKKINLISNASHTLQDHQLFLKFKNKLLLKMLFSELFKQWMFNSRISSKFCINSIISTRHRTHFTTHFFVRLGSYSLIRHAFFICISVISGKDFTQ